MALPDPADPGRSDDSVAERMRRALSARRADTLRLPVLGGHDITDGAVLHAPNDKPSLHVRLFGSSEFFRLWLVQLVGATGDWLGILAVTYLAAALYPGQSNARAAATSLVIGVRLLPHLFLSPWAGVIIDRFNRRTLMVVADLARVPVLLVLPFTHSLLALVAASVVLEVFTLVWTPSKEAITPHLVPHDHLTTANSLNMAAGFGSFLPGSLMFALLAGASAWLADVAMFDFLRAAERQIMLPLFFDAATFVFSAAVLWRLPFPERAVPSTTPGRHTVGIAGALRGVTEGWHYIFINHTVRAVNLSLGIALIGGGMLVPLGAVFSSDVLGAGAPGFGLFTTAIGFGVALGVVGVAAVQKRLPKATVFSSGLFVAGIALFLGAASSWLAVSVVLLFVMGAAVGPVYVLGYSLLHENVDDEMRGRVFAGLNTLVRMCVFLALVIGPVLSAMLGVRLTLWLDAALIAGAGFVARHSVRLGERS